MTKINNEVQKPDDATLILKRMLNATPERAFRGVDHRRNISSNGCGRNRGWRFRWRAWICGWAENFGSR